MATWLLREKHFKSPGEYTFEMEEPPMKVTVQVAADRTFEAADDLMFPFHAYASLARKMVVSPGR